ncbi:renin receptor-like [Oppia nitens]|uniref:renin receptor-like n=1 Tax=Oppia nitens TaxID=1686743 RepID=UPI0023D9F00A|nr:renin receptor-like [Oppia nitens]
MATVLNAVLMILAIVAQEVKCQSNLHFVYLPKSVRFSPKLDPIKTSSIADLLSLTLGYSLPKSLDWKSFDSITDVFSLPKACLTVRLVGQHNFEFDGTQDIPIEETQELITQWDVFRQRTEQRFSSENRVILRLDSQEILTNNQIDNKFNILSNDEKLNKGLKRLELQELLSNVDQNDKNIKSLVIELETIYQFLEMVNGIRHKTSSFRDLYWFDVRSFAPILDHNKYDESVRRIARNLLNSLIEKMTQDITQLYSNKVVVTVIEDRYQSPHLIRNVRASEDKDLNLAHVFDPNFHSAFATIAFTTILIAVAVFGISVAMWNIDPGKDSIIYRMTSQRIKKDQ